MRKPSRSYVLTALIVSMCAACASVAQSNRSPLAAGDWRLVAINGVAAAPNDMARRPTIRFTADSARATGSGGCNSYGGSATINGSSMVVSRVISTKRACMDATLNEQETRFFRALETVDHYGIAADTLLLYHGSGVALRFVR